jgi:hypothetical protein
MIVRCFRVLLIPPIAQDLEIVVLHKRKVNFRLNIWTNNLADFARVALACFDVYYKPEETKHVTTI